MARSALVRKQLAAAKAAGITEREFKITMAPEPEPEVSFATRIPKSLRHKLRVYCSEKSITAQQFIIEVITQALEA